MNTLNVILLSDSVVFGSLLFVSWYWDSAKFFLALHHSSSYYGTGTQQKRDIVDANEGFFFKFFFLAARHPADFDDCPTAGAKALASISLIPWHPCHSRPALHRRVPFLRCEHSISVSARHFLVVLHIETRVTRFRWRSVCLSVNPTTW